MTVIFWDSELTIDIETYSPEPIKSGVYKYADNKDFQVLLFAYSLDGAPVKVVDIAMGEQIPQDIIEALTNPRVLKKAYNAQFERVCLSKYLGLDGFLDPNQWHCDMVHALMCGLPGSLAGVGKALHVEKEKLESGKTDIQFFCKPFRGRQRKPSDAPERWERFKRYNARDVETEMEISRILERIYTVPEREWELYHLDQRVSDYGLRLDMDLIHKVLDLFAKHEEALKQEADTICPGLNIKSVPQVLAFAKQNGVEITSLAKEELGSTLESALPDKVRRILEIRKEISKTSVKKYQTCLSASVNGRIHGTLQFYGGARTGRWAGRILQVQNLPRPEYEDVEELREAVKSGTEIKGRSLNGVFSSLIRTCIIADDTFSVADYSAIECRVIAWLANENWVLEAFREGKDIYCETASKMFGVPVVKHGENGELRSKGKIATLACGYGGGVGALKAFHAEKMGMSAQDMQDTIDRWRQANPRISALWGRIERTAVKVIEEKAGPIEVCHGVRLSYEKGNLYIELPAGRKLVYFDARYERVVNIYGREAIQITYAGTVGGKWSRISTWGGKLAENITQAIARDCLATALLRLEKAGIQTVMHIHDEVVTECADLDKVVAIMSAPIPWAPGLELTAEGFTGDHYRKE